MVDKPATPAPATPMTDTLADIPAGAYVLATKYADGDPGDAWAVGFYLRPKPDGRHLVVDTDGKLLYGPNGFRRVRPNLKPEVGKWLLANARALEQSPPGSVNIWTMLTDAAFEQEQETGSGRVP